MAALVNPWLWMLWTTANMLSVSQTCHWSSKSSELRMRPFVLRYGSMLQHRICFSLSLPDSQKARES